MGKFELHLKNLVDIGERVFLSDSEYKDIIQKKKFNF